MDLTVNAAFVLGRALELARGGDDDVAIFVLDRDWPEGLAELQKLATEINVKFEDNTDYIIECYCKDECGLPLETDTSENESEDEDDATETTDPVTN